ncbi:Predicted 3'-5' exonuclease related to the exonuclease domain of PolB [Moraxella lacunata]|uniref:Predicted 3'-5' exonuclease related to the exonuclease domain of PolB n=1 Tax=Moraxella lacunata TaxID=477 RepID=A0A378TT98_MORLA|nr:3'-5' exonuclease [Moraxella lacunata]STZ63170.1 Predicted 3'-5' exonuclease related to the exonuclease domain of PolB [Moraxella lacunata]
MTTTPILVFDIETIPDLDTGRLLYPEIATLSDDDAQTALTAIREAEAGNPFMRLPLHKIACLSFLWVNGDTFSLKSLALNTMSESEILATFFRAFKHKPAPTLVSWNGVGFDLPVILYRAMHHKLSAPTLFNSQAPNYLYKYGEAHLDLMDKLSLGNYGNKQKLDTIASLCGFAGKGGLDGSQVVPMVKAGQWDKLATYCESDVLNTWLIYLRWQLLTGKFAPDVVAMYEALTHDRLSQLKDGEAVRHAEFLEAWR